MIMHGRVTRYLALAVALALTGACSSVGDASSTGETQESITADYPGFESIADAADYADLVIVGRYLSSKTDLLYPSIESDGDPISNPRAGLDPEDIDIDGMRSRLPSPGSRSFETLKGDMAAGETIEVSQVGGRRDGVEYAEASTTFIKDLESDQVVLFLSSHDDQPFDLINPTQGLFEVNGERVSSLAHDPAWTEISTPQELRAAMMR